MKILVVGDIHEYVTHPGYLPFCQDLYEEWDCNAVIFIGDIVDWHAISFHSKHPACPGPMDEYMLTAAKISQWRTAFPQAKVCIGNHDERVVRLGASVGIPEALIRDYAETWKTDDWEWQLDFTLDDVYYCHGTGVRTAMHPAWNISRDMSCSAIAGHIHSAAGIKWRANPLRRYFAMDVGCGVDVDAWQFVYGKHEKRRPILAAGVVLDGIPYHEIMPCGVKEKYHKSRFTKKRKAKAVCAAE